MAINFKYYNFVCIHQTLGVTQTMAAKDTEKLWELTDIVRIVDEWESMQKAV